jgi:hypothetical protein
MLIPYPYDFQIDTEADRLEGRHQLALKALDAGDVIAVVEDMLAAEPDPRRHPIYPVVAYYLDRGTYNGSPYWGRKSFVAAWGRLIETAIDRLVDERLAQGED